MNAGFDRLKYVVPLQLVMLALLFILLDGGAALVAFVMMCVVLDVWFLMRVVSSRWMISLTVVALIVGLGASVALG